MKRVLKQGGALVVAWALLAMLAGDAQAQGSKVMRVGHRLGGGGCGCGIEKGGCGCGVEPTCGVKGHSCGSCGICCPGLLPALVEGVGNLVEGIFGCCKSHCGGKGCDVGCAGPKVRGPSCFCHPLPLFSKRCGGGLKYGGGPKCGCGAESGLMMPPSYSAPDPFMDDELAPPPIPATEASAPRPARRPASSHAASYFQTSPRESRTVNVSAVQPVSSLQTIDEAEVQLERSAPRNPLR